MTTKSTAANAAKPAYDDAAGAAQEAASHALRIEKLEADLAQLKQAIVSNLNIRLDD